LDGYVDPELTYDMPMEITEWNVKCWGNAPKYDIIPDNPGFENGLAGWNTDGTPGSATTEVSSAHVRRGTFSARISLSDPAGFAEISQSRPAATGKERFYAAGWIRTDRPDSTHLLLRQSNSGEHAEVVIGEATPTRIREWEWIVWGGNVFADTTDVELAMRVEGGSAEVFLDDTRFVYWDVYTNTRPMSANTYAQRLFGVDALRVMMEHGVPNAHYHHLIGNYPCGCLEMNGNQRYNSKIFEFFAGRTGDRVVKTTCNADTFDFDSYWDAWATDFNAVPPSTKDVPVLSTLATRDEGHTYLLLVNRLTDRDVEVDITVHSPDAGETATVRTFQGEDYTIDDAEIVEGTAPAGREFTHTVPAHSGQILMLETPGPASSSLRID